LVADLVKLLLGRAPGFTVFTVAVGHSRRPDSFAVRLAAAELDLPFAKILADRFAKGVSHPKELKKLRPLERLTLPTTPVPLIDDVATSGWHLEETVTNLRAAIVTCLAIAWISGTIRSATRQQLDFGVEPLERTDRIRLMLASSLTTFSRAARGVAPRLDWAPWLRRSPPSVREWLHRLCCDVIVVQRLCAWKSYPFEKDLHGKNKRLPRHGQILVRSFIFTQELLPELRGSADKMRNSGSRSLQSER
jgi:hypothetical protein